MAYCVLEGKVGVGASMGKCLPGLKCWEDCWLWSQVRWGQVRTGKKGGWFEELVLQLPTWEVECRGRYCPEATCWAGAGIGANVLGWSLCENQQLQSMVTFWCPARQSCNCGGRLQIKLHLVKTVNPEHLAVTWCLNPFKWLSITLH